LDSNGVLKLLGGGNSYQGTSSSSNFLFKTRTLRSDKQTFFERSSEEMEFSNSPEKLTVEDIESEAD
jgi:hypothetical protein